MIKRHTQNLIILGSIATLVIGGGIAGGIYFQQKIVKENVLLQAAREDIVRAETEQNNSQVRKLEYERYNESVQSMKSFFVSVKDILSFISSLERVADANHVHQEIQSLQPPQEGVNTSSISLIADGSITDLRKYVAAIESVPTFIGITTISMQKSGTPSDDNPSIRMTIEATLQWQ